MPAKVSCIPALPLGPPPRESDAGVARTRESDDGRAAPGSRARGWELQLRRRGGAAALDQHPKCYEQEEQGTPQR